MILNHYILLIIPYLQVPGGKLAEEGLKSAAMSVHQEINSLLVAIIVILLFLAGCVIKYLIKEKTQAVTKADDDRINALKSLREDHAKETAINEGNHQRMMEQKTQEVKYLQEQNKDLKLKFEEIVEDNTDVYKQLTNKIAAFVEGQAVIAAQAENHKTQILLELNRLLRNTH